MSMIQDKILEYIDDIDDDDDGVKKYNDLVKLLLDFKQSQPDKQELKSLLYLISKITKNHHRTPFFFDKIKKIILIITTQIKQAFSNIEIFNIFKSNKRILLLLIDEDILKFDSEISTKISKYEEYFLTEMNKLKQDEETKELPEFYEENRRKGENESYVCKIIRDDDIEEFTIYCTKNSFSSLIESSIYETNSFLKDKKPTLIEYAAFYGSIQVFKYLIQNQIDLTQSLWIYAIHGRNPEIIHFLEENHIEPEDETYQECLKESIKCHHNEIAMYLINNYGLDEVDIHSNYNKNEISYGFHYYNYQFIPNELKDKFYFFYATEYNHYKLVEYFKNIEGLDINESIILIYSFALI